MVRTYEHQSEDEPVYQVQQGDAYPIDQDEQNDQEANTADEKQQKPPNQNEIVQILFSKTSRRNRTFQEITKSTETVQVLQANGSVASIIDWAKKAKLDKGQKRAFKVIAATFVLSFYSEAGGNLGRSY